MSRIDPVWKAKLNGEFKKEYFIRLAEFVKEEYRLKTIYPPGSLIFNAFNLCPFQNVKAVIIGQDPYHGPGQHMDYAFQQEIMSLFSKFDFQYIQRN